MKMNKKLTKRFLAVALSLVVALTTVFAGTPVTANAAAKTSITSYTSVKAGNTVNYTIKNLQKGQYAKVTFSGTAKGNILVKKGTSKLTSGKTKIVGTGKNIGLTVKTTETAVGRNYVLKVSTYNSKTNKRVSTTATKSAFVYKTCTAVKLDKETAAIKKGETVTLTAAKTPANATNKVIWSSSDKAIATVTNGVVTGTGAGKATITVKCGSVTATCEVTVTEDAVITAAQTGAKKITVNFNQPVDTAKAKLAVTKGTSTINISEVKWVDAKTAELLLSGSIIAADYTVTATGVGEKAITAAFKGEASRVAKIEITSENAILNKTDDGTVSACFQVVNQFGEDLTASTVNELIITTSSTGTSAGGTAPTVSASGIVITQKASEYDAYINKTFALTIVHPATGMSASKTLTVVSKSVATEITVVGLYNKDKKVLDETTDLAKNVFYLEVEVKDQYGNLMDGTVADTDMIATSSNPTKVALEADMTEFAAGRYGYKVTLAEAGTTPIILTSKYSGKSVSYEFVSAEAARAYNVTINQPEVVAEGETIWAPITVTNANGETVTDLAVLTDAARGIKIGAATATRTTCIVEKGQVYAKFGAAPAANSYTTYTVQCIPSYKIGTATMKSTAKAYAAQVVGLYRYSTASLVTKNITVNNLIIADQYGRTYDSRYSATSDAFGAVPTFSSLFGSTDGTNLDGNVKVIFNDAEPDVAAGALEIIKDSKPITLAGTVAITRRANGTEKITIALEKKDAAGAWKPLTDSNYTFAFSMTDGSEYTSYSTDLYCAGTFGNVSTLYAKSGATIPTDYKGEIQVYGVLPNGGKILLTAGADYYVTGAGEFGVDAADGIITNEGSASANYIAYAAGKATTTASYTVTINATGESFVKEITFSTEAPRVAAFDNDYGTAFTLTNAASGFGLTELTGEASLYAVDQYGVYAAITGTVGNDKFTDVDTTAFGVTLTYKTVSGTAAFAGNGTYDATIVSASDGAVIEATLKSGAATSTITLTINGRMASAAEVANGKIAADVTALTNTLLAVTTGNITESATGTNGSTYAWTEVLDADNIYAAGTITYTGMASKTATIKVVVSLAGGTSVTKQFKITLNAGDGTDATGCTITVLP